MVETHLCKLRDTSDTLIGRACAMFQLEYGVCELHLHMVVDNVARLRERSDRGRFLPSGKKASS